MMKPVPFSWTQITAWVVFIQLTALAGWMWSGLDPYVETVMSLGFSGLAVMSYPGLPNAGWGIFRGWNLCSNRATFLVAAIIHLTAAAATWTFIIERSRFEALYAIGMAVTGLMLVRAYSQMRNSLKS